VELQGHPEQLNRGQHNNDIDYKYKMCQPRAHRLERLSTILYRLLSTVGLTTVTVRWLEQLKFISRSSLSAEHGCSNGDCSMSILILEDLNWLPVRQRVVFKMALMVCKCIDGVAPAYLSDLCIPAMATTGRENLRLASHRILLAPHIQAGVRQQMD